RNSRPRLRPDAFPDRIRAHAAAAARTDRAQPNSRRSVSQPAITPQKKPMKSLRRTIAVFAATCLMTAAAFAADPSGNWKWTQQGRGGGGGGGGGTPREASLTLAAKDGKLTGKLTMPGRE